MARNTWLIEKYLDGNTWYLVFMPGTPLTTIYSYAYKMALSKGNLKASDVRYYNGAELLITLTPIY